MKKLHERIRDYIVEYHNHVGFPPSTEEIGAAVGIKSKSTVCSHLKKMDADGSLKVIPGQPRCISVPGYVYVNEADFAVTGDMIPASTKPPHNHDVLIRYINGDHDVAFWEGGSWRRGKYLTEMIDEIEVEGWRPLEGETMSKAELIITIFGRLIAMADHAQTEEYRKAIMQAIFEVMEVYENDRLNEGTDCMAPEVWAAIQKILSLSEGEADGEDN